ncbi:hypothetical protein ACOCEA_00520 [Maribacter sp. CXY002]
MKNILPLVNWSNGIIMIVVFAVVVLLLVSVTLSLMIGGRKKEE